MGLDITAYEFLEFDRPLYDDDMSNVEYLDKLYESNINALIVQPCSDGRDRFGGMKPGIYKPKYPQCGTMHFRAGSYGFYNGWRNRLSEVMCGIPANELWQDPEASDYPFYELIHFSDCGGVIAGKVAKKLADDFSNNYYKAIKYAANLHYPSHPDDSEEDKRVILEETQETAEGFLYKYTKWMEAFQMASNDGAVEFG